MIENIVLGLYAPIVFFSAYAVWMLFTRLLLPAFKDHRLNLGKYAIAISAFLSLLAHAMENSWYGLARWNDQWAIMNGIWPVIGLWKVVILASSFFAVVALQHEAPTKQTVSQLAAFGIFLWMLFTFIAQYWK